MSCILLGLTVLCTCGRDMLKKMPSRIVERNGSGHLSCDGVQDA